MEYLLKNKTLSLSLPLCLCLFVDAFTDISYCRGRIIAVTGRLKSIAAPQTQKFLFFFGNRKTVILTVDKTAKDRDIYISSVVEKTVDGGRGVDFICDSSGGREDIVGWAVSREGVLKKQSTFFSVRGRSKN